jgi:hypothetical protein
METAKLWSEQIHGKHDARFARTPTSIGERMRFTYKSRPRKGQQRPGTWQTGIVALFQFVIVKNPCPCPFGKILTWEPHPELSIASPRTQIDFHFAMARRQYISVGMNISYYHYDNNKTKYMTYVRHSPGRSGAFSIAVLSARQMNCLCELLRIVPVPLAVSDYSTV